MSHKKKVLPTEAPIVTVGDLVGSIAVPMAASVGRSVGSIAVSMGASVSRSVGDLVGSIAVLMR